MLSVYKYELQPNKTKLRLPKGAQILTAAAQGDGIFIWALVDPATQYEEVVSFSAFGTGHDIPSNDGLQYVNTAFMANGLVFHIFRLL